MYPLALSLSAVYTRYMHAHHVPHAEHVESCRSDEMAKRGRDDVEGFEDVSGVTHRSTNAKLCGVVEVDRSGW